MDTIPIGNSISTTGHPSQENPTNQPHQGIGEAGSLKRQQSNTLKQGKVRTSKFTMVKSTFVFFSGKKDIINHLSKFFTTICKYNDYIIDVFPLEYSEYDKDLNLSHVIHKVYCLLYQLPFNIEISTLHSNMPHFFDDVKIHKENIYLNKFNSYQSPAHIDEYEGCTSEQKLSWYMHDILKEKLQWCIKVDTLIDVVTRELNNKRKYNDGEASTSDGPAIKKRLFFTDDE